MQIRRLTSCLASLLLAFMATNISAQSTYYWNPTGSTDEQGGSGTIDTTTPLWNTSNTPSATLAAWASGSHALFAGSGGTVTSNNASLTTGNVTFKNSTYTLVGNLNLSITGNLIAEQFGSLTVKDTLTINATSRFTMARSTWTAVRFPPRPTVTSA